MVLSSMRLESSIPEWLTILTVILFVIVLFGTLGWALVLELRYIRPYMLQAASPRQKWIWAAKIMLLKMTSFLLLGLIWPLISPEPNQWPIAPLLCSGTWLAIYPLAVLYQRWDLERHLKRYRKLSRAAKDGTLGQIFSSPFAKPLTWFMSSEMKRFLEEGYPDGDTTRENKPPPS